MCVQPILVKRKTGAIDGTHSVRVPCGRCLLCLKRRANAWSFRLLEESKSASSCFFFTYTYKQEHLPYTDYGEVTLRNKDHQDYMKRLRKYVATWCKARQIEVPKIRYYAVGEYGGKTGRPHFHSIMFNVPQEIVGSGVIENDIWKKGTVHVGEGNEKTFRYCAKYMVKNLGKTREKPNIYKGKSGFQVEELPKREFERVMCSKGLGSNFLTEKMINYVRNHAQGYIDMDGFKVSLPRYYKDKIFRRHKDDDEETVDLKRKQYIELRNKSKQHVERKEEFRNDPKRLADFWKHHDEMARRARRTSTRD